jgi:hypothetical protein
MDEQADVPVLSYGQMKAMDTRMKQARKERFLEQSRRRLDRIVCTKVRTSFIGALAAFEEEFGFLWGHNSPDDQLTPEQANMLELWDCARTKVLNNGNAQLRAVRSEISNQTVEWNRHHIDFQVQPHVDPNPEEKPE